MLSELHEASTNEIKVLKLEMEALRADNSAKDEQLNMLYTVMEHHLGINVQSIYNSLEIKRVEERRAQREKELAKEETRKRKELIVETQEGSSSQLDVEMVDAEDDQSQWFELVSEATPLSYSFGDIICRVHVEQRKRKAREPEMKLIRWKEEEKVIEEEEEIDEELEDVLDAVDNYDPSLDDFIDKYDDEDQGSTGLIIPSSPEKEYVFKYAYEADNFNDVIVEDYSDSSDEDTVFHYSRVDETFPTLTEMFKEQNEDEVRRKVVEKISTEGILRTIPRETLAEERRKWFKMMPNERKFRRPLQYFTHNVDLSWGDILSWGYLEDLQVYAIRREQEVQDFEFLSDIKTLPWWDVEELVQTKNIKQFYYGLDVKQYDQHLWNYIKLQAKERYPDWKP
ncbi:hypothetical protein Hanom_Chr07g00634371 [Helianthus anomalus]